MRPARLAIVGVTISGITLSGYLLSRNFTARQGTTLMMAVVTRGDIEESVLATGTLKPIRLVAVGAQVSGRITSVRVKLGQTVKAGDLIAEIDSITQQNSLRTAEASAASVKAQIVEKRATLALNRLTLTRQTTMVAQKAVSQSEYESAEAAVTVTLAQIESLEAQNIAAQVAVETAKVNLGYTRVTAPIDGTVLMVVSQEGQTVNAVQSAPTIVILGDLTTMTVRTEISEADITKVRPGLPISFSVLGDPDRHYDAVLESIEPAPESIRNDSSFSSSTGSSASSSSSSSSSSSAIYYNGVFNVPNNERRLKTYMTAQVNIVLGRARNVLTIPSAALGAVDSNGRYTVRVAGADGALSERKVRIGLNNKFMAEVTSGLDQGEKIVTGEFAASNASARRPPGPPGPMGL